MKKEKDPPTSQPVNRGIKVNILKEDLGQRRGKTGCQARGSDAP